MVRQKLLTINRPQVVNKESLKCNRILHIVIGGREKLKAPAMMTVEATGVVTMGGGNSQKITIDPSSVAADGTYTTAEVLVANSAGTFGVKVTVTVDEQKK